MSLVESPVVRRNGASFAFRRPDPPAVVIGGKANAVSVARSLTRAGVEVYALGDASSPVRHSRARGTFVDLGGDGDMQARWLEWLASGPPGAVLMPCSDEALELIVRNRKTLVELGYRPFEAEDDVAIAMLDKARTYDVARELGIPSPRTVTVSTPEDVARVGDELSYPFALKPLHSHVFQRHCGARTKAFIVREPHDMVERLDAMRSLGVQMLATEIIPGADDRFFGYYTYLDAAGLPLFHFTKRKLRQYPVGFGTGSYHITSWDPEVIELGLAFVQGAGVRGLANVEFKRDPRDGQLKLIECNHRFTAPNELIRIAGLDLAVFVYDRLLGRPVVAPSVYRTGVRLWHPVEDTRAFLHLRRQGDLTLGGWLASVARPQHVPIFRWEDPNPSIREGLRRARRLWNRPQVARQH